MTGRSQAGVADVGPECFQFSVPINPINLKLLSLAVTSTPRLKEAAPIEWRREGMSAGPLAEVLILLAYSNYSKSTIT